MIKRIMLAAMLAAVIVPGARAADLPKKAPALSPLATLSSGYSGSGLYVGFNMGGGGGSASMANASTINLQGLIGLTAGYAWAINANTFAAIEADFDMMNLSTGSNVGLTFNGPLDFEQRFIYGFPVQSAIASFPIIGNILGGIGTLPPLPLIPNGVTALNSHMYLFAGIDEKDVSANLGAASNKTWLIAPEVGFGNRVQLSNTFATDTSLAVQFDSRGTCVGAPTGVGCGNLGTSIIGKLKLLY